MDGEEHPETVEGISDEEEVENKVPNALLIHLIAAHLCVARRWRPWRRMGLLPGAHRFATAKGAPLLILMFTRILLHADELLLKVLDEVVGVRRGDVTDKIVSNINMN